MQFSLINVVGHPFISCIQTIHILCSVVTTPLCTVFLNSTHVVSVYCVCSFVTVLKKQFKFFFSSVPVWWNGALRRLYGCPATASSSMFPKLPECSRCFPTLAASRAGFSALCASRCRDLFPSMAVIISVTAEFTLYLPPFNAFVWRRVRRTERVRSAEVKRRAFVCVCGERETFITPDWTGRTGPEHIRTSSSSSVCVCVCVRERELESSCKSPDVISVASVSHLETSAVAGEDLLWFINSFSYQDLWMTFKSAAHVHDHIRVYVLWFHCCSFSL